MEKFFTYTGAAGLKPSGSRVGLIVLALMLSAFSTARASQSIDFVSGPAPLPSILERLSGPTGQQLSCDRRIEHLLLQVEVKQVQPSALLEKIAKACSSEWKAGARGLILTPQPAQPSQRSYELSKQIELAKANALKSLGAEPGLNGLTADIKRASSALAAGNFPSYERYSKDLRDKLPLRRMVQSCIAKFPSAELARLARGEERTYTVNPNPLQLALPRAVLSEIEASLQRQGQLAASLADSPLVDTSKSERSTIISSWLQSLKAPIWIYQGLKPYVTLRRSNSSRSRPAFSAALRLVTSKGQIVLTEVASLQIGAGEAKKYPLEPIELSRTSRAVAEIIGKALSREEITGVVPAELLRVRAQLLQPDVEPLALLVAPILVEVSTAAKLNLVANLTDHVTRACYVPTGAEKFNVNRFLNDLQTECGTNVELSANWLVLSPDPESPLMARFVPRKSLRAFLAQCTSSLSVSTDALQSYARASGDIPPEFGDLASLALSILAGSVAYDYVPWPRVFSLLDELGISAAEFKRSGALIRSSASPRLRSVIGRMVSTSLSQFGVSESGPSILLVEPTEFAYADIDVRVNVEARASSTRYREVESGSFPAQVTSSKKGAKTSTLALVFEPSGYSRSESTWVFIEALGS